MSVVVRCSDCKVEKRLTDAKMLVTLQNRGMLRRESEPDAQVMRELLTTIANTLPCNDCGNLGLTVHDDWSDDWSDEVLCEGCQKAIDPERLAVFPDTRFCPTCMTESEAGKSPGVATEYCEWCGGPMKLAQRGGPGLAGYQMVCSDCGRKG